MQRITIVVKERVSRWRVAWRAWRGKLDIMFFNPAGAWRGERRAWWLKNTLGVIDAQKRSFRSVRVCAHYLLLLSDCLIWSGCVASIVLGFTVLFCVQIEVGCVPLICYIYIIEYSQFHCH